MVQIGRLRELDFLRGIAMLLVFLRHVYLFSFTTKMGWIGVDLFFVLSGFLVSGLLFKEYIKFGNINPKLFLIRRGFKIYPIYYIFYIPYLMPIVKNNSFELIGFMADMTFTQNYVIGRGYAYFASWSLAVEEHFYLALISSFWLGLKYKKLLERTFTSLVKLKINQVIVCLLIIILSLRTFNNYYFLQHEVNNFTRTHTRIDSLLFGVLIGYYYYFKIEALVDFYFKNIRLLLAACFLGLAWTPFIDPEISLFISSIGFSILYLSFGIILITFLLIKDINSFLNKVFTQYFVNIVCKIGYCSYSIYIIHSFCISHCIKPIHYVLKTKNTFVDFFLVTAISILVGMIMTFKVEKYFLRIRDLHYPSRI